MEGPGDFHPSRDPKQYKAIGEKAIAAHPVTTSGLQVKYCTPASLNRNKDSPMYGHGLEKSGLQSVDSS